MSNLQTRDAGALVRPLAVLAPLICKKLEAGDAAGLEYYREAGEMLIEAEPQCSGRGTWGAWVERNCHISLRTARRYMELAEKMKTDRRAVFTSLHQAVRSDEPRGPSWQAPVQRVVERVNMKALVAEEQGRAEEKRLIHALAEQLIDIGYKVLAAKLHPDKGGSREAMARLNQVRKLLKEAI